MSYSTREGAERAIREIGGTQIGSRVVRCGWAHHKRDTLQGADYLTIDQVHTAPAQRGWGTRMLTTTNYN